jgi:putative ATP-binding cassette transporter
MKIFSTKKWLLVLVVLVILDCSLGGYIGFWREKYWAALEAKNANIWLLQIVIFSGVALTSCLVSGFSQYIGSILALEQRTKLTKKALSSSTFENIEGGHQRVQEDCLNYPTLLINLSTALLRSLLLISVFSFIIISHLSWYYLVIPVVYALIGTILAGKIAFPLININYLNQVTEAKFRQVINKGNYIDTHDLKRQLYKKTKSLNYFQAFFSQVTVIFPHLVLAYVYFSGIISFGVFMQTASAIAEITTCLSVIILSFGDINNFLSCRKRLKEINLI